MTAGVAREGLATVLVEVDPPLGFGVRWSGCSLVHAVSTAEPTKATPIQRVVLLITGGSEAVCG